MDEMRLARRKLVRKNQGEGRGDLPLRRRYVREKIDQKSKYKEEVIMNPNDLRVIRLAEMDAEIAAQKRGKEREGKVMKPMFDDLKQQLSEMQYESLPEKAERIARTEGIEFGDAVRKVIANTPSFQSEQPEEGRSVHYMSEAEYERQLRQAMKERGYDV